MRSVFNKIKHSLLLSALVSVMLIGLFAVTASASVKGFNKVSVNSFCADEEALFANPAGTKIASGTLNWKLYDSGESRMNENGLSISSGYLLLTANNPLNSLTDFKLELVYSSAGDDGGAGSKPLFLTSTKKYTLLQYFNDSGTVLGIAENGDVYFKGEKINHTEEAAAADILTAKNAAIAPGEECTLTLTYIDGRLSVGVSYNSGKSLIKLVENYECEISGLQQLVLGGDKSSRLDGVTYKSITVSSYGEYVPYIEKDLKAVVQSGESIKEYANAETALNDAETFAKNGKAPVIKLYSDVTLKKYVTVAENGALTLDLNGHTVNRNRHSTMSADGCVFLVGKGAALTIEDSSPDSQNYSTAIRGGVITGGAGDDIGGGIQLGENSRLVMTGGSIVGCVTNDHGGAVRVDGSGVKISIENAGFYSNMTLDSSDNSHGGAIYADYSDCDVTVKNTIFEGNYSEDNGGAVYINDGKFRCENCLFGSNKSLDHGGAVYVESDSEVSFEGCTFTGNRAEGYAGAVYCNSSDGTRLSGVYKNNSAGRAGGAIFINGDRVSIQDAEITGNTTGEKGGGVYVDEMYDINIQGLLTVKGNFRTDKTKDDIFLDSITIATARIYNGGLYDGSEVWVLTSGSSQVLSEYISEYQQRYFYCDDSSKKLSFTADKSKTQSQALVTSAIGKGNTSFIISAAVIIFAAAAAIAAIKFKKKGAVKNDKKS